MSSGWISNRLRGSHVNFTLRLTTEEFYFNRPQPNFTCLSESTSEELPQSNPHRLHLGLYWCLWLFIVWKGTICCADYRCELMRMSSHSSITQVRRRKHKHKTTMEAFPDWWDHHVLVETWEGTLWQMLNPSTVHSTTKLLFSRGRWIAVMVLLSRWDNSKATGTGAYGRKCYCPKPSTLNLHAGRGWWTHVFQL